MKPKLRIVVALFVGLLAFVSAAMAQTETHPVGAHLTFVVTVDGSPAPTVEFFKNGAKFGVPVEVSPGTWHLVIGVLTANDGGTYTAKATNVAGSATSDPFNLTIATAPSKPTIKVITARPSAVTVEVPKGTRVITK